MGLLAEPQVQEHLAAGAPFPDVRDEAVVGTYIRGIEAGGLDPFLSGDENGPLVVELLADDDEFRLTENIPGPYHGVQGTESGVIQEDDLFGYSLIDQGILHLLGLVILFLPIIPADEDPVDFTGLIQLDRGIDPGKEKQVGTAIPSDRRRPEHQGRMVMRDIGNGIVQLSLGIPVDPDIAVQNESQQYQAQP